MSLTAGAKAGITAVKNNWFFFLLAASILIGASIAYDGKHPGFLRGKVNATLGKLPIVGSWFQS
jgi:hypothetical protein